MFLGGKKEIKPFSNLSLSLCVCSVPFLQSLPEDVIMKMSDLMEEVQIKYLKSEARHCVTITRSSNRIQRIDYVCTQMERL